MIKNLLYKLIGAMIVLIILTLVILIQSANIYAEGVCMG